jgi:hypothetical protein
MRAGLVANTFLEAMHIKQFKKKYSEYVITDEMRDRIEGCACELHYSRAWPWAPAPHARDMALLRP